MATKFYDILVKDCGGKPLQNVIGVEGESPSGAIEYAHATGRVKIIPGRLTNLVVTCQSGLQFSFKVMA